MIDYLFFVIAFNRGIRRIIDYNNGFFNPTSLISVSPIVVGGFAVMVVLYRLNSNEQYGRRSLSVIAKYSVAVAFAFAVGLVSSRAAAIYALGDYIAPIGLIGFGVIYSNDPQILQRWCNSIALAGLGVAAYGIWQFYTIPPWDAFWVSAVNFEGYLGILEPTKMTLFSTMSERGPAAVFLCSCLIVVTLKPRTLGILRIPSGCIILFAMLLTYSRTTVIQFGLAVVLYPLLNRGSGKYLVFFILSLALVFGEAIISLLPGSEVAVQRVSTIGNIAEDGSFVGRLEQFRRGLRAAASEPIGLGIGSHGLGGRLNSQIQQPQDGGYIDSTGYVEALRTFGWLGFLMICNVFWEMWRSSKIAIQAGVSDSNVYLFRVWCLSGLVAGFSGNWVFTATFFWVLGGYCIERTEEGIGIRDDYADRDAYSSVMNPSDLDE